MKIIETNAGYQFAGFTEICEAVLHTQAHGNVLVAMHEAENITINQFEGEIDHAYIIGIYRATGDSYNAEQFEYARPDYIIAESFYTEYEEAKAAYMTTLTGLIYDHGL